MFDDLEALFAAIVLTAGGYATWRKGMHASSLIEATATSRIASAAKGFVEITGTAHRHSDNDVRDPIRNETCLWFHLITQRRRDQRWETTRRSSSGDALVIDDGTSACLVTPAEADIDDDDEPDFLVKEGSDLRHKVWRIREGDALYALGFIERITVDQSQVVAILRVWKQDEKTLHARFDADRDGRIDAAEWDRARAAAREAVVEGQQGAAARTGLPVTHRLKKPDDGRPLLVSNRGEQKLARRKTVQSRIGLLVFVGGSIYLLLALRHCVAG